ncbi:MAG: ATP-binding protein [Thermoanaerobaculia bacterium]|nr:ATP-binding protein [Thermoanaerobaculia bacterium]
MPLVATTDTESSRSRVFSAYRNQGIVGLLLMIGVTWQRQEEVLHVWRELGPTAIGAVLVFFGFAIAVAFLKFPLTDQIFVSLVITVAIAAFPILGMVLTSWIAILATIINRGFDMAGIGPTKVKMDDPPLEYVKTFGLFGTYGIPVIAATFVYELLGGHLPVGTVDGLTAGLITISGLVLIVTNNLVMMRVLRAFGYSPRTRLKLAAIDSTIYAATIPFAIMTALAWPIAGWWGLVLWAMTGILANGVGRNLSIARDANLRLVNRLSSLTNIGKSISLSFSSDQLLEVIYSECSRVVDTTLFSIALYDAEERVLHFDFNFTEGEYQGRETIPLGEGLNSWVVENKRPLLLSTVEEESEMGLLSLVDDGIRSESWLGVPMMLREDVVGVISVQSYRKHAFSEDDLILLTAVANQAAVALVNARLYQDLERLNAELEERVRERTAELSEANLKLIAADRSKNQFLANMSHELRTPLNSIIGFSTLLLERTEEMLPPRLFRFIENIRTAGTHLLTLINDILDLSKIEAGRQELRMEPFDIRDTIATVDRVIKGAATEASVTVLASVEDDVPTLILDEGRVKQILLNLLSNALKFSPEDSYVYLTVSRLDAEESDLGMESVRIEVVDSGVGIEPEDLEQIFDEFYQVALNAKKKGGTGLGLSLTRSFVELHGGKISVTSTPGEGSTFIVVLPVDCTELRRFDSNRDRRRALR